MRLSGFRVQRAEDAPHHAVLALGIPEDASLNESQEDFTGRQRTHRYVQLMDELVELSRLGDRATLFPPRP